LILPAEHWPRRVDATKHRKPLPNLQPRGEEEGRGERPPPAVAGLAKTSRHGLPGTRSGHWHQEHIVWVCCGRVWRSPLLSLSLSLTFALPVLEVLFKHRRLARTGLEKSLYLVKKTLRNWSQYESAVFFSPVCGSAFFEAELLAEFGGNYYLAFRADYGAIRCHVKILP